MKLNNIDNIFNKTILNDQKKIKENQHSNTNKMIFAQLLEYDNSKAITKLQYLTEAKLRNAIPNLTVRNRIDDCFKLANKSAEDSAAVFQEAYKQQLLKEASLRNATPNFALRKAIDESFKISNKSAEESAKIFIKNSEGIISQIQKSGCFKLGKQISKII